MAARIMRDHLGGLRMVAHPGGHYRMFAVGPAPSLVQMIT